MTDQRRQRHAQRLVIRRTWEACCAARMEHLLANLTLQEINDSESGRQDYQLQIDRLMVSMRHHHHPEAARYDSYLQSRQAVEPSGSESPVNGGAA